MNLDIVDYRVLGMADGKDDSTNWRILFKKNKEVPKGTAARRWFAESAEFAYSSLATLDIKNLDDSIEYRLSFSNQRKLWNLTLKNTENPEDPAAEVDPKFKIDFMKDDYIKKAVLQVWAKLEDTRRTLEKIVMQKIETGEYIDINETKLEAELHMLQDQTLMANLKKRLFIK